MELEVRNWLRANNRDHIAAYCLYHLNRVARSRDSRMHKIYSYKRHLLQLFAEKGYLVNVSAQVQKKDCWSCNGTGLYDGREWCYKCMGSGVYTSHTLYTLEYDIGGRRYVWHQPKSQAVRWYNGDVPPVESRYDGTNRQPHGLPNDVIDLYMKTATMYLSQEGVQLRPYEKVPTPLTYKISSFIFWRYNELKNKIRRVLRKDWEDNIPF